MSPEPLLEGAQPIADAVGLRRRTVYSLVAEGKLPVFRLGRRICADPRALREWRAVQLAGADPRPGQLK